MIPTLQVMSEELTQEEVERRAGEVAQRLMSTPYQRRPWSKLKASPPTKDDASSTPRKPDPSGEGS